MLHRALSPGILTELARKRSAYQLFPEEARLERAIIQIMEVTVVETSAFGKETRHPFEPSMIFIRAVRKSMGKRLKIRGFWRKYAPLGVMTAHSSRNTVDFESNGGSR